MKTSKKKFSLICAFTFVSIILMGIAIYDFLIVELDELIDGELLSEYPSPNNDYSAKAYLDRGGSLSRAAIRVEIDFGKESKNIYWKYDESKANIEWLDNETIKINDQSLNIFNDKYDWRQNPSWEENRGK